MRFLMIGLLTAFVSCHADAAPKPTKQPERLRLLTAREAEAASYEARRERSIQAIEAAIKMGFIRTPLCDGVLPEFRAELVAAGYSIRSGCPKGACGDTDISELVCVVVDWCASCGEEAKDAK